MMMVMDDDGDDDHQACKPPASVQKIPSRKPRAAAHDVNCFHTCRAEADGLNTSRASM